MQAKSYAITVVVSRWNELVTKELLAGCLDELSRYGVEDPKVIQVPGTWEIPVIVKRAMTATPAPQAIVALGCILQGKTSHAQLLAGDVAGALMGLQVEHGIPVAWGILTPDDQEQALERAGMKLGNKGREAAQAAIEMAGLMEIL